MEIATLRCRHRNCIYRAHKPGTQGWENCDYLSITGKSRLSWHRERGLSEDPSDCQLFKQGKRLKRKRESPLPVPRSDGIKTTGRQKYARYKIKEARKGRI